MALEHDFYIKPEIKSLPQKITLMKDETCVEDVARNTIKQFQGEDWDEAFYVCDLQVVVDQYKRWVRELPNVKPHYALKACPLTPLICTLGALGCGFDCASKNEVNHVLSRGTAPDRIIFAHPNKMISHICHARRCDVRKMTFDNLEELFKVKKHFPEANLVLRLFVDDEAASTNFASKFGATVEYGKQLISKAKQLDLNIIGVAYHCGSGNPDVESYMKSNGQARELFDFAKTCGFDFNYLDIGGGFPGSAIDNKFMSFEKMAEVIRESLDELFPPSSGVEIVAEPGRYFAGEAFCLVSSVLGKKKTQNGMTYFIADGVFNSFSEVLYREEPPFTPEPLLSITDEKQEKIADRPIFTSTVFGPTLDGVDVITRTARVPEMQVGEWFLWRDMGSYSTTFAVGFNGYQTCKAKYFMSEEKWTALNHMCEDFSLLPETIE